MAVWIDRQTLKRVQGSESDLGALFLCARDCNGSCNHKRPNSPHDRGTGIVFFRDCGGDVWLTWFKKDDSTFVEFSQDGMLLLDAVVRVWE